MQQFTIDTGATKYSFDMTPQGMILKGADRSTEDQEEVRAIECNCSNAEEFPADMPRHHSQSFTHVTNTDDGEAFYLCGQCEVEVKSYTDFKENN